jgi:hypothetical protein
LKILNLFAGIGGNRSLWGNKHEITAVEFDPDIDTKIGKYILDCATRPKQKTLLEDHLRFKPKEN